MGPKPRQSAAEPDLLRVELVNLIDQRHELVKLASLIDWPASEQAWVPRFESTTGRPALPTRLMASLPYLKHSFALSDEDVVGRWIENPYRQHFSGEHCFRHELPCDPSSLVRWRQRMGAEGCEWPLEHSIKVAMSAGMVKRQSYARVGRTADAQADRYAHAQPWRRMRPEVKKLCTWLGRVIRDRQRTAGEITGTLKTCIETAQRLHAQQRDSKNKLYALHAPEVECTAKHVLSLSKGARRGRHTSSA
jgi:IS5 family transposase